MNPTEMLRKCTLCAQLNEVEFAEIEQIVSFKSVKKGEILFFQGDIATGFYVLLTGRVRIYKASPEGKEYTLHLINPGQMFAEAAIFQGDRFPANCSALEESTVAFFPKERFVRLIKNSPDISLKMIAGLAKFVREFNRMVEDLSLKEVSARLADFLIDEARQKDSLKFELDITKSEMAHKLGTIAATLSRNLKKFKEIRAIAVEGSTIEILDTDRLEAIAEGEKI